MKTTKKTIALLVLAASMVFLLTGCDQMLEALFQMNKNTIEINAQIPIPSSQPAGWWDQKVWFKLMLNSTLVSQGKQSANMIGNSLGDWAIATVKFEGLEDGNYTIVVWLDNDGNEQPTNGEWYAYDFYDPSEATNMHKPNITLPYPNPSNKDGRYVNLRTDLTKTYPFP